ncbi:MAG TPA: hypothetical protein VI078_06835 [bacterium]
MTSGMGKTGRIIAVMLAAILVVAIAAPAGAQPRGGRHSFAGGYGGHRGFGGHDRHGGYRGHGTPGWHRGPDGYGYWGGSPLGFFLGALGVGIAIDAMVDAQRPVIVEPPPEAYGYYQEPGTPPPVQYQAEYPPPRRDYPECREFIRNPGAMAFCEKGVLEREYEEQRLLEQKAYETGRGR